jgi:autotransporter passenger strand-loop-strand repeat protein
VSGTTGSGGTSGCIEYVSAGGSAVGTHLSGGQQMDYGTAVSAVITEGNQWIEDGGTANATVLSGGFSYVLPGGTASGTIISSAEGLGGYEYVLPGAVANDMMIEDGGLSIGSGASADLVTFSSFFQSGSLALDDSVHFGGLVADFGVDTTKDLLDLLDIPYISGTTTSSWTQLTSGANASGTLQISDSTSGTTADITLLGQYTAADFHVSSDNFGGTVVFASPVASATSDPLVPVAGSTRLG